MNLLDIDKRGKFQLFFSKEDELILHSLPTCRYRPGSKSMSLQPQVEVWKQLNPLIKSGIITTTTESELIIEKLRKAYIKHRSHIRSASSLFKNEQASMMDLPLKTTPYSHQVRAFGFSCYLSSSALLMEQGTGKTMVAIAVAAQRFLWGQVKRVLVICPKSVVPVWPKELKKHLKMEYYWDRAPKSAKTSLRFPTSEGLEIFVINYDKIKGRLKEILKWFPDMVILDESHRIKSQKTGRSKSCHKLGDEIPFKLILTGTVLGQSPIDAWSQYRFINADVFGRSYGNFKGEYCRMGGYKGKEIKGYKNLDEFSEKLHSIAFRTTKKECLDLPEESSQSVYCEPSTETLRIYRELNLELSTKIDDEVLDVELTVSKIMKLRQITGGMVKHESGKLLRVCREKLLTLEELLVNKNWEKKLVIAVSFTHEMDLISGLCDRLNLGYITLSGKTSEEDRFSIEERFRKDFLKPILILQVDTGGEGLDFVSADMVAFYSPTFSFIKVSQVKARIHRIGQDSPVTYVYFVMEGTIDEDVVKFLEEHGDLTELILEKSRPYKLKLGETMTEDEELEKALKKISDQIKSEGLNVQQINSKPKRKKKMAKKKEETPKKKVAKKKVEVVKKTPAKKKAVPAKKEKATKSEYNYVASDMADELGIEPSELRKALRGSGVDKPEAGWKWATKKAAVDTVKTVKAYLKGGDNKPQAEAKSKKKVEKEVPKKKAKKKAKK